MEVIDKRTKEYRDSQKIDYSKIENNPGFRLCMKCGQDKLPLGDDGQVKNRRVPEACWDCIHANKNKYIKDGKVHERKVG